MTRDTDHRKALDWKQAALTDALTGVGNRRRFASAWAGLRRKKDAGVGVLLIDIDRFKAVNDTHGHAVGDKVLKMVARTLGASLRQGDAVVRWGGEEFVILVSPTTLEQLADLAERLRQLVARSWVVLPEGGHLSVTVSVGAALVRQGEKAPDALARADTRLLTCKAQGRNRVLAGD
jgi:two-component system cell cycle response regulator